MTSWAFTKSFVTKKPDSVDACNFYLDKTWDSVGNYLIT